MNGLGSESNLLDRARKVMPGGVNSPVRAFAATGGRPPFIRRGSGAYVWDAEGRRYIDMVCSWGPLILGHAPGPVVEAVTRAARNGLTFGACTEAEVELAEAVVNLVPGVEKVRLVNSGTEATMAAVRLARAATGRDRIVKFEGCYHGHADSFLVKAGSGALTFGAPSSPGVPAALASLTLNARYNDASSVRDLFEQYGDEIACVIVEPVAGNMGVVHPEPGFLETLREVTTRYGALLVFDEVITGFRLGLGGAQERFGIVPDLTTLGKVLGGGLPVGAYGGRADLMDLVAPTGPVYQAGTLSGNPLATAAGLATLRLLQQNPPYAQLDEKGKRLQDGLQQAARAAGVAVTVNRVGSMLTCFFRPPPVRTYDDAVGSDTDRFARFHRFMLASGVYLPPSQFEAWFISTAHSNEDIDAVVKAASDAFKRL